VSLRTSSAVASTSVWFPRPRAVELRDEPLAPVGARQIRVRAVASAISHGTEMLVYRGEVPADVSLDLPTLRGAFGFPIKYGYASVGRVVDAGAGVQSLARGALVFVHHPHQTAYDVDEELAVRLPDDVDVEAATLLANLETATNVVLDAHPHLGDRVVVLGQGVVGLLVTQLVRRAGASLVVAVDPIAFRREFALHLGAHEAVSPGEASAAIRELTAGVGADIAIEASGTPSALGSALDLVAFQGSVVVCSWYGAKPVAVPLGAAFHRRRLRIVSSQVSNLDPALAPRWDRGRRLAYARSLLAELDLARLITHRFPLAAAPEAYRLIDEHPEATLQVIFTYP
jgi:2-desacetyl-2-hydroxyethyl bacteriochlorophyllide A dehydrogenase